jgi:exodeoxyribonuclease V alpha subunit
MPELNVTIERVLYPSETAESRWFILLAARDGSDVVCKGNIAWRPRPKERLRLIGEWSTYQGKREFKFTEAALDLPTDARGMLHYVCEIASGVGDAMESQIWDLKGEAWATIKDGELPRLRGKIYQNLMEAIERAEADREKGIAIAELLKAGATINMANAAWELWGSDTMGVVMSDPYRLADLPNYGFAHVDGAIRLHYGIGDNDPRRIKAAVIYTLKQITSGGSTLVKWDELLSQAMGKLGGYSDLICAAVSEMFSDGTLKGFKGVRGVALASDFRNESIIWEYANGA